MLYYDGNTLGNHDKKQARETYAESVTNALKLQIARAGTFELKVLRKLLAEEDSKAHGARCRERKRINGKTKVDN